MLKPLSITVAALAVTGLVAGSAALANPDPASATQPSTSAVRQPDHRPGGVVSSAYLKTFGPREVDAYVEDHHFARPHSRYAVDLYRLVYRTTGPDGRPTTASGLVALPRRTERRLRLTADMHGTISNKDDAASVSDDDTNRAVALMFGGAGLAVAAPDYLGLGRGPGRHPYVHLASETSASVDLLLATRQFTARRGLVLDHDVLVSGFSQGGRVAVNLGKQLQQGRVPGFGLGAVAAVAGPFDLEHAELPAAFAGGMDPKSANYYLAYLVTTWKWLVGLYDDPAEAFKAPYDKSVEKLFDGHHSFDDIMAGLPATPADLFQPAFVHKLLNPTGAYARLLRAGDTSCKGWQPAAPVRLYYGSKDREVVPANTANCLKPFTAAAAAARAVSLGPIGHFESWFTAYPQILDWFTSLDRTTRRGALLDDVPVVHLTAAQLDRAVAEAGFAVPPAKHGVDAYRLVYRTITPDGRPTIASGLVALPTGGDRRLRLTTYLHGTTGTKTEVASMTPHDPGDRATTLMFAGAGQAAAAPDYLGLGISPGRPPYVDTKSETSSSIDLLIAFREFAARRQVRFERDVLVTGFSQGGRAALAVGRALQQGAVPGFGLGATAGVAGPYDLERIELPAAFDGRVAPQAAAGYLGYFLTAWNRLIPLYDKPADAFRPKYAPFIEDWFDGYHSFEEIGPLLPQTPQKLLTDEMIQRLTHPSGPYLARLREADTVCKDWTPATEVRLYSGTEDRDVIAPNADSCAASLRHRGAHAEVRSMGAVDHGGTAQRAYPQILAWFTGIR